MNSIEQILLRLDSVCTGTIFAAVVARTTTYPPDGCYVPFSAPTTSSAQVSGSEQIRAVLHLARRQDRKPFGRVRRTRRFPGHNQIGRNRHARCVQRFWSFCPHKRALRSGDEVHQHPGVGLEWEDRAFVFQLSGVWDRQFVGRLPLWHTEAPYRQSAKRKMNG